MTTPIAGWKEVPPCPCAKDCGHAAGMHWVTLPDGDGGNGSIHCTACDLEEERATSAALRAEITQWKVATLSNTPGDAAAFRRDLVALHNSGTTTREAHDRALTERVRREAFEEAARWVESKESEEYWRPGLQPLWPTVAARVIRALAASPPSPEQKA